VKFRVVLRFQDDEHITLEVEASSKLEAAAEALCTARAVYCLGRLHTEVVSVTPMEDSE